MVKTVREADTNKIDDCKDDIDTLLVFVRAMFAVTVARSMTLRISGWSVFGCTLRVHHRVIQELTARQRRDHGG